MDESFGNDFERHADAMLETWELSYFRSPGLRLFFTLRRAWTDQVLPLEVSRLAEIERVMIGRIELISPAQHELLWQIAAGPTSHAQWYWNHLETLPPVERLQLISDVRSGEKSLDEFKFEIPMDYKAHLALGRFREALVLNEFHQTASPNLRRFIQNYRLNFLNQTLGVRAANRPPLE